MTQAPAYVVAELQITDEDLYARYRAIATESMAPYGGRLVLRGVEPEAREGDWESGTRMVIFAFDDVESARAWYESPAYGEGLSIAPEAMRRRLAIFAAAPAPPS